MLFAAAPAASRYGAVMAAKKPTAWYARAQPEPDPLRNLEYVKYNTARGRENRIEANTTEPRTPCRWGAGGVGAGGACGTLIAPCADFFTRPAGGSGTGR